MNKKVILLSSLFVSIVIGITSCEKTFDDKLGQQKDLSNKSIVQVVMATVGTSRNFVYVDGKLASQSFTASGGIFPGGYGLAIEPGLRSIQVRDTLATAVQVPIIFSENMQVNKNYTIFLYDTITSPRQITVPTGVNISSPTSAMIRFANLAFSKTAVPAVDIYSVKRRANIFTNISTTQVTDFVPQESEVQDTFYVRSTGSPNNLTVKSGSTLVPVQAIFTPTKGRLYSLVFRGRYQTDTISTIQRTLSVYTNK